jgi:serine/threonine protein kinase
MSTDPRLRPLLDRWQLARLSGEPLSAEDLCRDCPELRVQVEQHIAVIAAHVSPATEPPSERAPHPSSTFPPTIPDLSPTPPPPISSIGAPLVPGYDIECELARGGMGVVYRARQMPLNRVVALKMILSGVYASPEERLRFLSEAKVVASLSHPGIVQLHDFGTHGGTPYFAMEYCPGGTLAQRLHGTPLPVREAASLVEQIARAVQAAHEKGIIHRDLKPANVLLAGNRGMPDGTDRTDGTDRSHPSHLSYPSHSMVPKITDFGLARNTLAGSGLTQTGMLMGTPSYMAPEQTQGQRDVGPAVDVYAMGAIFYECLTGRPPFNAATTLETLEQVRIREPAAPRSLQPGVPRDLETICLKALQKEPGRRYASAAELADDLRRWQSGEPIHARPIGIISRAVKWVHRRPLLAVMAAATLLALVGGTAFSTYFAIDAREQKKVADLNAAQAHEALKEVEENLALGLLRALGHYEDKKELNPVEQDALEELAGLPPERDRVRLLFFEKALRAEARAEQLDRRLEEAITAAVGLRRDLREKTLDLALEQLNDSSAGRPVCVTAARLAAGLKPADRRLARDTATVLVEELGRQSRRESLQAVARSLGSMAHRIAPEDATVLVGQLVGLAPRIADTDVLRSLAEAVVALLGRLPPARASTQTFALCREVATRATKAIDTDDTDELLGLSEVLAVLACTIASPEAAVVSQQIADLAGKTTDLPALLAQARAFAALAKRLAPAQASPPAALLGKQLGLLARRATGPLALRTLSEVLAVLAPWLAPAEVHRMANDLDRQVAAFVGKATDPEDLRALGGAFVALAGRLPAERVSSRATVLAKQVTAAARSAELPSQGTLSEAYAAVAGKLPPEMARARAVVLAGQLDPGEQGSNADDLFTRSQVLVALAPWLDQENVNRTAGRLASRFARTLHLQRDNRDLPAVFERLCGLLSPKQLVSMLKEPGCVEPGPTIIVKCLGRHYRRDFRDVWDVVEYAR